MTQNHGLYDGVSASGNATLRLMVGGNVAPVNVNLISNYKDINPALKDQPYNTYKGVHYGIPHGWGANLLMWRTDAVNPAPTSWAAVFDPNSPYKGKITAYDDPIYIADAALYLKTARPDLHITDAYELTTKQFDAAVSLLKQQRANIGQYWSDYTKEQAAFANGDSVLGTTWQVITNLLVNDAHPTPVKAIVPSDGSTGWSDTWMVSATAAHPNCMYKWMEYISSPSVQAHVASWYGEAPANPKACPIIAQSDNTFCDTYHVTDAAYLQGLALWKVPLKDCGDGRGSVCTGYQDWLHAKPIPRRRAEPRSSLEAPPRRAAHAPAGLAAGAVHRLARCAAGVCVLALRQRAHLRDHQDVHLRELSAAAERSHISQHRAAHHPDRGAGDHHRRGDRVPHRVRHGQAGRAAAQGGAGCRRADAALDQLPGEDPGLAADPCTQGRTRTCPAGTTLGAQ